MELRPLGSSDLRVPLVGLGCNNFGGRIDAEASRKIPLQDDEVHALYNQIYRELMTFIIADPKTIEQANWLLWVAHNLERFADRVTNICERTIFIATGELTEVKSSDDEFWKQQKHE
jgi:phosphate uptake regulator